jgi:hypothetical protein
MSIFHENKFLVYRGFSRVRNFIYFCQKINFCCCAVKRKRRQAISISIKVDVVILDFFFLQNIWKNGNFDCHEKTTYSCLVRGPTKPFQECAKKFLRSLHTYIRSKSYDRELQRQRSNIFTTARVHSLARFENKKCIMLALSCMYIQKS